MVRQKTIFGKIVEIYEDSGTRFLTEDGIDLGVASWIYVIKDGGKYKKRFTLQPALLKMHNLSLGDNVEIKADHYNYIVALSKRRPNP